MTEPIPSNLHKSFLIGPSLYLRGVELDDAKHLQAWRPTPFPTPAEFAREKLTEEIPDEAKGHSYRLVACRRTDDLVVGSVHVYAGEHTVVWISLHTDPNREGESGALKSEMLTIVVPYLVEELDFMSVWFETPGGDEAIARTVAELGMRQSCRQREVYWSPAGRRDLIGYELLHPLWIERLGLPPAAEEGAIDRIPASPAPRRWSGRQGDAPANAFAVGNRLYLRPIDQEDATEMARWSIRETDTFHDQGRSVRSPISFWHWHKNLPESNPPGALRFAIVTIDGDTVIGANGLMDIDWINRCAETESDIVRPDYRNAGYGTEAKHLLLEYVFERLNLHMVKSFAWEYNTRSVSALIKQGYRVAGRISWTGVKKAEFINDMAFDLLADEWRAHRQLGKL